MRQHFGYNTSYRERSQHNFNSCAPRGNACSLYSASCCPTNTLREDWLATDPGLTAYGSSLQINIEGEIEQSDTTGTNSVFYDFSVSYRPGSKITWIDPRTCASGTLTFAELADDFPVAPQCATMQFTGIFTTKTVSFITFSATISNGFLTIAGKSTSPLSLPRTGDKVTICVNIANTYSQGANVLGFIGSSILCGGITKEDVMKLPFTTNQDNLSKVTRQISAVCPEFAFGEDPSNPTVFIRFAPDVSRICYDNTGRIWALICPQFTSGASNLITLELYKTILILEVSVTSVKGYFNEFTGDLRAQVTLVAKLWFSEFDKKTPGTLGHWLWEDAGLKNGPDIYPFSKKNAVQLKLKNLVNGTDIIDVTTGLGTEFVPPGFTIHPTAKYAANLGVEVGDRIPVTDPTLSEEDRNKLNQFQDYMVTLEGILTSGTLVPGNPLYWNIFLGPARCANKDELIAHSALWAESTETSLDGNEVTGRRYNRNANGDPIIPTPADIQDIKMMLTENFENFCNLVNGADAVPGGGDCATLYDNL